MTFWMYLWASTPAQPAQYQTQKGMVCTCSGTIAEKQQFEWLNTSPLAGDVSMQIFEPHQEETSVKHLSVFFFTLINCDMRSAAVKTICRDVVSTGVKIDTVELICIIGRVIQVKTGTSIHLTDQHSLLFFISTLCFAHGWSTGKRIPNNNIERLKNYFI